MATNKTINPTNVTVQIPAMADKPNQATNSNCLDKIIDGVNAVDSKINTTTSRGVAPLITASTNNSNYTINTGEYFVVVDGTNDGTYKASSQIALGATWADKCYIASLKGGLNALNSKLDNLISSSNFGNYSSRTDIANGIVNSMSNGEIKIGRVGLTGATEYLFLALRRTDNIATVFLLSGTPIRLMVKLSGTWTEYSITGT